ncbi:general transcriptional corepressor trfA isoform X2 [Contarinia nasturtii]|uniref:general transcriptional corepressor trfA isoform X2 n=1 Tax=Contarinia nasturtii TaxID=265458 RepID=UPI0012D40C09|nr:general transcriptional corepressor trfA isoform X2 [Contarinia nasturtii]
MDSAVLNTHQKSLQRPHTHENLNGPRVSFNKDVHVKRIGGRSNENNNNNYGLNGDDYPVPSSQQPQITRELPSDLSEEQLIKEAEKVIAQTERIKCTVDTPNSLAGIRLQEKLSEDRKFNSLPHRKKKSSKPLGRSVSDASSQKKPKRASIFNLFSKRSDPNLSTVSSGTVTESPRSGKRTGKPVGRSKSDVGYNSAQSAAANNNSFGKSQTLERKRIKIPDNDESMTKAKKKSQLSPISENPPGEKLFGFTPDERKLLHYTKSEEKRLAPALHEPMQSDHNDYYDDDDDNEPTKLIANKPIRANHSRSLESLHSSQLPQEKLPLTKGLKVDGMVKRLSMDRFSPPLHFNSPAFSYTRPAEPSIVYAQVRRDENGDKAKSPSNDHHLPSTIHRSTNLITRDRSPIRNVFSADTVDNGYSRSPTHQRQTISTKFLNEKNRELHGNNNYRQSPIHLNGDRHPTEYIHRIHLSDEDEGLGFDDRKRFDDHMTPVRDNVSRQSSSEPPIIPTLRPSYGSIEHLANRRKLLESKIHERSFDFGRDPTPKAKLPTKPTKPTSPLKENHFNEINIRTFDERFPEPNIVPSPRKQWSKQPKYYPETNLNDEFLSDIDTLRREQERQRHKTYLDRKFNEIAIPKSNERVIDLGYIDQYNNNTNTKSMNNNNGINQNLNHKHRTKGRAPQPDKLANGTTTHHITIESNRRKLDKADSGIEHDFKRDRDHGDNNNMRFRRLNLADSVKEITELFLKRECQLSESLHPSKKRYEFVFRERSIDDGSHFDPRLDKYPEKSKNQGTLTRPKSADTKKSDKKFNSLKKLFSISSKKKSPPPPPSIKSESSRKHNDVELFHPQSPPPPSQQSYAIDIATRRRLSTPKASPIPKRIPSQKSSKISHVSSHRSNDVSTKPTPKTSWFKSLERLSRKNKAPEPKKPLSSIKRSNTTLSRPTYQRAQSPSPDFKPTKNPPNLRFFGDTDMESLSKAATTNRKREPLNTSNSQSLQNLRSNRNTNLRSGVDSDGSQKVRGASSMQSLHRDVRSKYLPDLSESTSENENINGENKSHAIRIHHSTPNNKHKSRRQYHSMEYLENEKSNEPMRSDTSQRTSRRPSRDVSHENSLYNERNAELLHRSALRERNGRSNSETRHLPPKGPTKPARESDRRRALSNDRFLESSGTEGDSSQQSVVYLHATTIGHIPQPYVTSSRRSSKSRDELSSIKSKSSSPMQPMTRTVSRSVSMLAPWTPRHLSDGYEINYSQTMQNPKKSSSTLTRDTRGNHIQSRSKDDLSSVRSSSQAKMTTLPKHRK